MAAHIYSVQATLRGDLPSDADLDWAATPTVPRGPSFYVCKVRKNYVCFELFLVERTFTVTAYKDKDC